MKTYQLHLFDGHPIIHDGDHIILIDTGAPSTIHTSESLTFGTSTYHCTSDFMGLTVAKLSDMLGTEITTLLGSDVLSKYKILFDYRNGFVTFSEEEISIDGIQTGITNFMGIPIIEMSIDGKKLKFFLDTGAKLSYLPNVHTRNYTPIGTLEDFYPGYGVFTTECVEISTHFEETELVVKYGNLPELLQSGLMMGGTDGIIGFDFFYHFKLVLDLKNNLLTYGY